MAKTTRTFAFNTERDKELLAALDSLPDGEKSSAVREGLRLYFGQKQPKSTLVEVLEQLESIREGVDYLKRAGMTVGTAATDDDDPALKNALLNLGL